MWYFVSPQIMFGEGALEELGKLDGHKAFVITDAVLSKTNLLPLIEGHLTKAGLKKDVFGGVEPEPSIQTVKAGAEVVRKSGPDWIVGMGGGSDSPKLPIVYLLFCSSP
jgi:alcohol dehydrogenase class IV